MKVARFHIHDRIILLLLVVIEIVLNDIEPFHLFVGRDVVTDLRYPLKSNTVPVWAMPIIAIVLPFAIFSGVYYRRDVYDLHHGILGLLYAVLLAGVIKDALKDAVGRPRPDFFLRCFPNGTDGSFAGQSLLAWYLADKIQAFDRKGHIAKLCLVLLPLVFAGGLIGLYPLWHHWQDVFAGGLIGWGQHAYFQVSEDAQDNPPPARDEHSGIAMVCHGRFKSTARCRSQPQELGKQNAVD